MFFIIQKIVELCIGPEQAEANRRQAKKNRQIAKNLKKGKTKNGRR